MKAGGSYADWPEIPIIGNEHIVAGALLFANRKSMLASLPLPAGPKIAEIGVWRGTLSTFFAEELRPRQFFAFDIFSGHTLGSWNNFSGSQLFDGMTHRQFYEREMGSFRDVMVFVEGPSQVTLRDYTDRSFDLVYVDGDHAYEAVRADADLAAEMVSESGFLVFNDYIMRDTGDSLPYGVVPVVNDLVVNHGWRVAGFAFEEHMYCDIALCRAR